MKRYITSAIIGLSIFSSKGAGLVGGTLSPTPGIGGNVSISNTFLIYGQAQGPALTFATSNNITDPGVINNLIYYVTDLMRGGIYSNLVDMIPFSTQYRPWSSTSSNGPSFFGGTWSGTGVGSSVSNNNFGVDTYNQLTKFNFTLPTTVTSNTIVITWRYNHPIDLGNVSFVNQYRASLFSLCNPADGSSVSLGYDLSKLMIMDYSPGGVRSYGGIFNRSGVGAPTAGGSNEVTKISSAGNTGGGFYPIHRHVTTITSAANGAHTMWDGTRQHIFNAVGGAGVASNTWYSYVLAATNQLSRLNWGLDTNTTSFTFGGLFNTNFFIEIESISVFNSVFSSNEVFHVNRANRNLNSSDVEDFYDGDSLMDISGVDSTDYTNGIPSNIADTESPYNDCWRLYAIVGCFLQNMTNQVVGGQLTGQRIQFNDILSLPYPYKVKRIRYHTDMGVNDMSTTNTPIAIYTLFTNLLQPIKNFGAQIIFHEGYPIYPEAGGLYTAARLTNYFAFASMVSSNGWVNEYVPWGRYITRVMLANTALSTDAAHLNGGSAFSLIKSIVGLYRTKQWSYDTVGGFPTSQVGMGRVIQLSSITNAVTIVTNAGGGAGVTAGTVTVVGSDTVGLITINSGATPQVSTAICTLTFQNSNVAIGIPVITPANANAALLSGVTMPWATNTVNTMTLTAGSTGLTASTTYQFWYHIIRLVR